MIFIIQTPKLITGMRGQNKVSGVMVSFPSADHPLVPGQSVPHTHLLEVWDAESTRGPGFPFSSVTQLRPALCDPMDCSMPGFPVHHQLLKLSQTHVHQVGDAIQSSHPLSSPPPPAFNLSQNQGLFQ